MSEILHQYVYPNQSDDALSVYENAKAIKDSSFQDNENNEQSTQSFNSTKMVVRQKKINKKKDNLVAKQFSIQFIPSFDSIKGIETLFIVGEVFIVFDFDNKYFEETHISKINNYKRIQETSILKQSRFLEVKLEYKVQTEKYFYLHACKLLDYPDQDIHDLGLLLKLYQGFCFEQQEELKNLMNYFKFNTIEQQLEIKKEFDFKKQKYLDSFLQDEFIQVLEMGQNIKNMEFEMECVYFSEPLLLLLGTTLEQYERYLHRFGINEFVDSKSQLAFLLFQLKQILKSFGRYTDDFKILKDFNENQSTKIILYTFDGIQISGEVTCETILPEKGMTECKDININPYMLLVVKYDIEATSLQQLLQIRQNQENNKLEIQDKAYFNEIDFSLDYSMQSEIFYEMAKLHNIHSKSQPRASFRYLTKKEQGNLKQYNVSCPEAKF